MRKRGKSREEEEEEDEEETEARSPHNLRSRGSWGVAEVRDKGNGGVCEIYGVNTVLLPGKDSYGGKKTFYYIQPGMSVAYTPDSTIL